MRSVWNVAALAAACGVAACGGSGQSECQGSLTVSAGPAQTVAKSTVVRLSGTASGGRGTLSYSWKLEAIPSGSSASLTGADTQQASFTADVSGTYVASLSAKDSVCGASTLSTVVVSARNSAPVASAGPDRNVMPGDTVTLDGSGSQDPDHDSLAYSWSLVSKPAGSAAALSSTSAQKPTLVPDQYGTYVALLSVSDGAATSEPSAVVVQAGVTGPSGACAPAPAPVAAIKGGDLTVQRFTMVALDGSTSVDGRAGSLRYAWSLVTVPTGSSARVGEPNGQTTSFWADQKGVYVVSLVVNDGCADSAPAFVKITRTNLPPTVYGIYTPYPQPVPLLVPFQLSALAYDDDNDPLTFSWQLVSAPPGSSAAIPPSSNQGAMNFTPDLPGSYQFAVSASDGTASTAGTSTVTVTAADLPPVAQAGARQAVTVGETVALDASASSDPSRRTLTFAWTLDVPAGSSATLSNPSSANPTFVADASGIYRARVTVTAGGLTSQARTDVAAYTTPVTRLPRRPIAAAYSRALDRLAFVAADPAVLVLYDPRAQTSAEIPLPLPPLSLSLAADGKTAAVGHAAAVSIVDLVAQTATKLAVGVDASTVLLGDMGSVYSLTRSVTFGDAIQIASDPLGGGTETLIKTSLSGVATARLRAGTASFYVTGSWSWGIEKYSIATPMPALVVRPFNISSCGDLWLAQAGDRLFNRCGQVFRASSVPDQDLMSAGSLSTAQIFVRHLEDAGAAGELSAIASPDGGWPSDDLTLRRWTADGLVPQETVPFPTERLNGTRYTWYGRYVFYRSDGSERYVVLQLDQAAGVLQDFGIVTF